MNKTTFSLYITGIILLTVSGCLKFTHKRTLINEVVSQEKLHKIEPLKLPKTQVQTHPVIDINEISANILKLTLPQCRAMALQNNLELQATLINPSMAAERITQERAIFEATFSAGASINKTDRPFVRTESRIQGTKGENKGLSLGLSKPLITGGTASFNLSDNINETDAIGSRFNPNYGSNAKFSLTQPLLRNAGAHTLTQAIRLAGYQRQITDAQTKLAILSILANLDKTYWRLYAARKELDVRKQQYHLAQTQLEQAQRLVNSGDRAQIEILRAQAGIAERLESIIIAQNNLYNRQRELKRIINHKDLNMQSPVMITPLTKPIPQHYSIDHNHLVQSALKNRMEILVLEIQVLEDMDTIKLRKNQKLPLINFTYNYNLNAFGSSRDNSYDMLTHSRFANHYLGLNAHIPLGNNAAKSRLRQAIMQRIQRLSTKKNRENLIKLEVLNAADKLLGNLQRIQASQQNTIVAAKLYEAEKRQYNQDQRTSTDVLNAQTNLANAQLSELSALVEYQIALVDLAHATGTLMGAANIQWTPLNPVSKRYR